MSPPAHRLTMWWIIQRKDAPMAQGAALDWTLSRVERIKDLTSNIAWDRQRRRKNITLNCILCTSLLHVPNSKSAKSDEIAQEVKTERFLISTIQNNVRILKRQTDIKHEKEQQNKLTWMSLLKIAVQKLPPSQRSSLELSICTLFCLVDIKKRSFFTSCVFWFILLNASSHLWVFLDFLWWNRLKAAVTRSRGGHVMCSTHSGSSSAPEGGGDALNLNWQGSKRGQCAAKSKLMSVGTRGEPSVNTMLSFTRLIRRAGCTPESSEWLIPVRSRDCIQVIYGLLNKTVYTFVGNGCSSLDLGDGFMTR